LRPRDPDLLHDDDISGTDLIVTGERQREGVGVIEAPRGTLFHHYQVDETTWSPWPT
jgi:NAD-reducing hydrogenase large subunit